MRTAEEVHAMTLANLHGEYCTVIKTADVVKQIGEQIGEQIVEQASAG